MRIIIIALFILGFQHSLLAQPPIALYDKTRIYREANDLFDHEKYVAAKEKFQEFIALEKDPQQALRINSEYYNGICALYLFHKDAEYQLEKFVLEHPDSPWKLHAYFELATFNYQKKQYKKTLEWFEMVDERDLNAEDRNELRYKRGHSLFETGNTEAARQDFFEVKQVESEYQKAAIYYYSHIAYEQNDLQVALDGFRQLENDEAFKGLVPYYITYIYYKQKNYDEVLKYGPGALQQAEAKNTKRVPEISRIIGDSHCMKKQYAEAVPFLETYHKAATYADITREDHYQLGYAYHRSDQWQKSILEYGAVTDGDDELHQKAAYNLGECYLKINQKEYARNAFAEAADMSFNAEIQEDALFNYSKLAFELSYNPFHEAIAALEDYLNKYPNSKRHDEVYEFLLNVYMRTRNYEKALASLDKIKNKDERVKEAYQVVAYNRGVELFQAEKYADAEKFFDKVPTYPINPTVNADAKFWKAEISYRLDDYAKAAQRYAAFINEPGAYTSEFYGIAHYSQGYAYFKMANAEENMETATSWYNSANTAFRKYIDGSHGKESKKVSDAAARAGDCFYVAKNYAQAILYYDKAVETSKAGSEYALYQKAMCYGYDGQPEKKSWVLKNLITESPNSKFEVDSKYEIAKTYLQQDRLAEAKTYFNDILKNYATSPYAKLSMRDMCLIYVKEDNPQQVKDAWVAIKTKYKKDPVVCDAYQICKAVLIEDPEFQNDAVTICGATKDELEEDVYRRAVSYVQDGNCETGITKLTDYLSRFQPAYHALDASYFLANCYYDKNDFNKSLEYCNYVIAQGSNNYLEECLVMAATIAYNNKDYSQALTHYRDLEQTAVSKNNVLEAQIGLMRCNYLLNEFADAKMYADKVIANDGTPEDIRYTALLWRGRILHVNGNYDEAIADLKEVVKRGGNAGAESKYLIASSYYSKEEFKAAETEIFQLIEKFSAFDEWKYKGFLLLIDVYISLKDYFQAHATINAILENVTESSVVDAANAKKATLEQLENPTPNAPSVNDVEINLDPEQPNNR
jgi:tetratricopeptide (TPR) repeat protein